MTRGAGGEECRYVKVVLPSALAVVALGGGLAANAVMPGGYETAWVFEEEFSAELGINDVFLDALFFDRLDLGAVLRGLDDEAPVGTDGASVTRALATLLAG